MSPSNAEPGITAGYVDDYVADLARKGDVEVLKIQKMSERHVRDLGWIGRLLGGSAEKSGNVAAIAIALSFVMISALLFLPREPGASTNKDAITIFAGVITLALGYLFGHSGKSDE